MNPEIRNVLNDIMKRLDMHEGEWPGIEVFCSKEGRHVWGLLPEDLYQLLIQLNILIYQEEQGNEED